MIKRIKENKKGFTLAELLIVVAIIGVLVAVSIPIFTAQLQKARLATNQANARAAYAAAVAEELGKDATGTSTGGTYVYDVAKAAIKKPAAGAAVTVLTNKAASNDISTWEASSYGKTVAKEWAITLDDNGAVTAIYADVALS